MLDVVELIHELTDEDAGADYEEAETEETEEAMKLLIDSLVRNALVYHDFEALLTFSFQVENSIFELLVDNLSRLNEAEEADRQGVFHILGESILLWHALCLTQRDRYLREHPEREPRTRAPISGEDKDSTMASQSRSVQDVRRESRLRC